MAALVPRRLFAPWLSARASRSLAASAALCAKTQSKATSLDPVQQLFLEKLKEYETKSSGRECDREEGEKEQERESENEGRGLWGEVYVE